MKIKLDFSQLSFTYNADGYMLTYRGKNIGGVGVKLPREKPLHWRHRKANIAQFKEDAEREITYLRTGQGQSRFLTAMQKIEEEEQSQVILRYGIVGEYMDNQTPEGWQLLVQKVLAGLNIATMRYETKHGSDVLVFVTDKEEINQLPRITNALIESTGAVEPNIEGSKATEEAGWEGVYPLSALPRV